MVSDFDDDFFAIRTLFKNKLTYLQQHPQQKINYPEPTIYNNVLCDGELRLNFHNRDVVVLECRNVQTQNRAFIDYLDPIDKNQEKIFHLCTADGCINQARTVVQHSDIPFQTDQIVSFLNAAHQWIGQITFEG